MSAHLLIFDSGVGGLSILHEIRQQLPNATLHYVMDNAAYPYGTKADDFLITRILNVCTSAVERIQPDVLIIACNTASTLALPLLRETLDIPVVGVVPAIKVAAAQTKTGQIGLLATPATVNRPYTDTLIQEFAPHCHVRKLGSSHLVQWAENWIHHQQEPTELKSHLDAWLHTPTPLSHVVLGCTHFPLLKPWLQRLWPEIHWVDSGEAIARRVKTVLNDQTRALEFTANALAPLNLYWTDSSNQPVGVVRFLNGLGKLETNSPLVVIDHSNK